MTPRRRTTSPPTRRSRIAREIPPSLSRIPAIRRVPAALTLLPTAVARRSGLPSRATGRPTTARSGSRTSCTCVMSATGLLPPTVTSGRSIQSLLQIPGFITTWLVVARVAPCSMTPTPPARTRGITSSRRPAGTGSSTWPVIGSNGHRSSSLPFGKCLFICGRPVRPPF